MKIHTVVLSLLLLGMSGIAVAQWQWLDKDGRKVFSDRAPPPDIAEKDILRRPSGPVRASAASMASTDAAIPADAPASSPRPAPVGSGVDKDLEAKKKQAAEAEAAKRRAEEERVAKIRIENCAQAKQSMANFNSGMRIARTNAAGEREVLDDSARAAERAKVQKVIDSECR